MNSPLVYIILVNYKGLTDTIACLDSLKEVIYTNYKTIVVDNASPDDSYKKLQEEEKRRGDFILLQSGWNGNWSGGNNYGIEYALKNGAEYICLLNNDTVVEPDFLNALVEPVLKDKKIGLVGGKIFFYKTPEILWYAGASYIPWLGYTWHHGEGKKDSATFSKEKGVDWVTGCLMFISREALEKVGKAYEGYFFYMDDVDWSVRIKKKGFKVVYQPKSIIYHKIGATHKGSRIAPYYYGQRNAIYCLFNNFNFFTSLCGSCARLCKMLADILLSPFKKNKVGAKLVARVIGDLLKNKRGQVDLSDLQKV